MLNIKFYARILFITLMLHLHKNVPSPQEFQYILFTGTKVLPNKAIIEKLKSSWNEFSPQSTSLLDIDSIIAGELYPNQNKLAKIIYKSQLFKLKPEEYNELMEGFKKLYPDIKGIYVFRSTIFTWQLSSSVM